MPVDAGSWLWVPVVLGVAMLGAAIAFGSVWWRQPKNPTLEKIKRQIDRLIIRPQIN
jgi:hypothetical protein